MEMKGLEILASDCKYKPGMVAKARGLSLRQLQRIIRTRFGMTPRRWLRAIRTRVAAELLASGRSVKNAQLQLQYKDARISRTISSGTTASAPFNT